MSVSMGGGFLLAMAPNLAPGRAGASLHPTACFFDRHWGRVDRSGRDCAWCPQKEISRLTDWIEILKQQTATGDQMSREVPQMLANPEISEAQVKTLFSALEKQADFVEKLRMALEKFGHDFAVIKAAERLEERYADLAASVAEKLKAMRE
jgi:hypothetical protein